MINCIKGGFSLNEIRVFNDPQFGDIRTAKIDGKDYFCGNDVASALCYSSPKNAVSRHCKGALYWCPFGETQKMKYIPEGDMYRLIVKASAQSNSEEVKKKAEEFEEWIFDTVLPSLRMSGSYEISKDPLKLLELHYEAIKQVDNKVNTLEERFNQFEQSLPLLPNEADEVSNAVKKRVLEILGGKESNAYKNRGICQKAFKDAYSQLKRNFGDIKRYKDIKREQKEQAVAIAGKYEPPLYLKELITQANAQMTMGSTL